MTGGPRETSIERRNMEEWLSKFYAQTQGVNTKFNYSLFSTMPLPGTQLGRQMHAEGRIRYSIDQFPELWNIFLSVIDGDSFTAEQNTQFREGILKQFGMQQDLGKVTAGTSEHEINPNQGKVAYFNTAKRIGSSLTRKVAALAASAALVAGIGSYVHHEEEKQSAIAAEAQQIRQRYIDEIPAFVMTKSGDELYGWSLWINQATEKANKEIKEKVGMKDYFEMPN